MKSAEWKNREFDVVVYGATGFVGQLTAQYLARFAPTDTKVALAGRSAEKLAQTRDQLAPSAKEWPLLVADADDLEGLTAIAARTRVIATTVGPYAKYGTSIVQACAEQGTDYVDLTGEVLFVRYCAEQWDSAAKETGARIVNSCGFDSIPSDLGVWLAADFASRHELGSLTDTTLVVRQMKGGFSGGTIDSMRNQVDEMKADPALKSIVEDPYSLSPLRADEPDVPDWPDTARPAYVGDLGGWIGPFVMAAYNTRIVRRSNALSGWSYGPDFRYREVSAFGKKPIAPVIATGMAIGLGSAERAMAFPGTRQLLDRVLPKPGEGPSEEQREAGRFKIEVYAHTTSGQKVKSTIAAKGDPGYAATAVMLSESALCLALDADSLPDRAGVLTPATAMGEQLSERLRRADFTVEVGFA
ncbi:MAG: saccharopine dehydrogenase NADP-binding domain-containing protein [Actinobacteria bacterium]|nr:saccharopine dehydrogenase NADP-binding domain-containing protein [Actinomycetota bacterium]